MCYQMYVNIYISLRFGYPFTWFPKQQKGGAIQSAFSADYFLKSINLSMTS